MLWGLFFNISKGTDCSVILNKVPFRFYRQEVLFLQPKKDSMYLLFCFRSFTFMHMGISNPIWIHWDHKEIPAQQRTVRLSLALTKETVKQMQQQNIFTERFFLVQLEWLNGRERTWTESENMNSDNISLTTLQIRSLSISFQSQVERPFSSKCYNYDTQRLSWTQEMTHEIESTQAAHLSICRRNYTSK